MENQNHPVGKRLGCTTKALLSITFPVHGATREDTKRKVTELCESFFSREGSRLPVTITDEDGCVLYTSDSDLM